MERSLNRRRLRARTTGTVASSVIRALVPSIALVVVLCSQGWASGSVGQLITINFSVFDEKNQPVADALVQVHLKGQLLTSTTSTDDHGKGSITVPSAGSYVFNVVKKGYITTGSTLEVSVDAGTEEVDVILPQAVLIQHRQRGSGFGRPGREQTQEEQPVSGISQPSDSAI